MNTPPDGGPAFGHGDPTHGGDAGMSLLDWFAGQALNGLVSQPDDRACPKARQNEVEQWRIEIQNHDAKWCYGMADAMLAARNAPKP